jgi:hypothetical protein
MTRAREKTMGEETRQRHATDADCRLDDEDCCVGCGVYHGDPCPECGGRGFHLADCSEIEEVSR